MRKYALDILIAALAAILVNVGLALYLATLDAAICIVYRCP